MSAADFSRSAPGRTGISSVCRADIGSAAMTARRIASKPKPASSVFAEPLELEGDEARHMGRIRRRQGEPDVEGGRFAVDPVEGEAKKPRAGAVADEVWNEIFHQPGGARDHRLGREDRVHELAEAMIGGRRRQESEGLRPLAEGLVETLEEFGLEARRERRPRLVDERADALEAEAPEGLRRIGGEAKRLDRQGLERGGFAPGGKRDDRFRHGSATAPRPRRRCRRWRAAPADGSDGDAWRDRRGGLSRRRRDAPRR